MPLFFYETMLVEKSKIRKPRATAILWLVLCAVLFSQYLGFAHRMAHFSTYAGEVLSVNVDEQGKLELRKLSDSETQIHSCLLVDGTTIFDALQHSISWGFQTVSFEREEALRFASLVTLPLSLPFYSRAPPFKV